MERGLAVESCSSESVDAYRSTRSGYRAFGLYSSRSDQTMGEDSWSATNRNTRISADDLPEAGENF